jgi:hypothetical protein
LQAIADKVREKFTEPEPDAEYRRLEIHEAIERLMNKHGDHKIVVMVCNIAEERARIRGGR